jgi:hypothetical protein
MNDKRCITSLDIKHNVIKSVKAPLGVGVNGRNPKLLHKKRAGKTSCPYIFHLIFINQKINYNQILPACILLKVTI